MQSVKLLLCLVLLTGMAHFSSAFAQDQVAPYGPTTKHVGLWKIAGQYSPEGKKTLGQTIVALLKKNERAFVDHNINGLKSGYLLQIPSHDDIYAITRAEAIRFIRAQNLEWQQHRTKTTHTAQQSAPVASLSLLNTKDTSDAATVTPHVQDEVIPDSTISPAATIIDDPVNVSPPQSNSVPISAGGRHPSLPTYFGLLTLLGGVLLLLLVLRCLRSRKQPAVAKATPQESEEHRIEVTEFAGDNDIDTKLDLCQGFIQQGNDAAARQLIEEILSEGDERQQAEANTFLSKLKRS